MSPASRAAELMEVTVFGIMVRYFMFDHPAMAWDPRFAASSAH
jgi:hypothetical protein